MLKEHARIVSSSPMWLKVASVVLILGLLSLSLYGVWKAHSTPRQVAEPLTLANYRHAGEFDYLVYVNPSHLFGNSAETPEEEGQSLYFINIVEDIDVVFNYDFVADGQTTGLSSDVDIVAIVTGPSDWQKEIPLSSARDLGANLSLEFPLELEQFDDFINEIELDLGIRQPDYTGPNYYTLVIEARVNINGDMGDSLINDTFVVPMQIRVSRGTLAWDNNLALSQRKSVGGLSYKHQGSFGYTIKLKENSLYGTGVDTLGKEPYQWPQISAQPPGNYYFTRITDIMLASFSYQFICNQPLRELSEEVEVQAILEYPNIWSKTFILVPKTQKSGEFVVDFSVDINFFSQLANTIKGEIDVAPATYDLTIMAVVHTTAQTDYGIIDEAFTQTLNGTLGSTVLTWNDELESSKTGSITGSHMVPNTEKLFGLSPDTARIVFPIALAIILPFSLYLLILGIVARPAALSRIEKEAIQAKKKHKELIVDVKELPAIEGQDITVVSLSSLDDLITTAENLFRPVLHKAEEERHIYCVIDGTTRYQYVSEPGVLTHFIISEI
ncbi:hypothetical protein ES707_14792 [subsurface metagenome]